MARGLRHDRGMSPRLPCVLSAIDLPPAELWAARLDGELVTLGDGFIAIDEIERPEHRARVVHAAAPRGHDDRLIAEQRSAAWVWGALERPPARHQLCVAAQARTGRALHGPVTVREVIIGQHDITLVAGLRVTTPLRTIIDLARFSETFDEIDRRAVSALMRLSATTLARCLNEMNLRRNLPGKHRARERLSRC